MFASVQFACFVLLLPLLAALRKVVVPAVYKEWINGRPDWATNVTLQAQLGYSVFQYQKLNPAGPHYLSFNRGTESGVYLRYIVDHYDDFPDVAIFVHAAPEDHQPKWLEHIGCISPTATYYNINNGFDRWMNRSTHYWDSAQQWMEQCWRDLLQTTWDLKGDNDEFQRRLPGGELIRINAPCCNQFLLSREVVRRRPLHVWMDLLNMIGVREVCHEGELDYENLWSYHRWGMVSGPEPATYFVTTPIGNAKPQEDTVGRYMQGCAMEALSHVVFGDQPLVMDTPSQDVICANFLRGCPGSPCLDTIADVEEVIADANSSGARAQGEL